MLTSYIWISNNTEIKSITLENVDSLSQYAFKNNINLSINGKNLRPASSNAATSTGKRKKIKIILFIIHIIIHLRANHDKQYYMYFS